MKLGERELDILQTLWVLESASVAEIHEHIAARGEDVAFTTIQTMLARLAEKGVVEREAVNRSYVYKPVLRRKAALRDAIGSVSRRFFRGSVAQLASHIVENDLSAEQLRRLEEIIETRRKRRQR